MGQKVNPHGLRVGVIKDWDSRWFANKADFGDTLVEDFNVRKFIKKNLYAAGVPKIEIERFADKVRIHIHCAKPGIVIGRGGAEIEKLRTQLEKMMGKQVYVNIVEVKQPDMDAQLVAEKDRFGSGKQNFLPPGYEAGNRPCNASGCKGYQDQGFRPFGRC